MNKLFVLVAMMLLSLTAQSQEKTMAEKLVQEQLDAYNNRDIEAFLKPYDDSVAVYMFPNQLLYKGKATMRQEYTGMFKDTPDLHCTVICRMVLGNKIIDEESVIFNKNRPPLHASAIYTIAKGKIVAVHFVSEQ
jgi:hypothetical protein